MYSISSKYKLHAHTVTVILVVTVALTMYCQGMSMRRVNKRNSTYLNFASVVLVNVGQLTITEFAALVTSSLLKQVHTYYIHTYHAICQLHPINWC